VRGDRIADATTVLMEIGVTGIVNPRFYSPVSTAKHQCIIRVGLTTAQEVNKSFLCVTIRQIEAVSPDSNELSSKRESKRFCVNVMALHLTSLYASMCFLNFFDLRGKKTPAGAGVRPFQSGLADCP
jgi:hypothetical protein